MVLDPEAREQVKELKGILEQVRRTFHQQPT